MNQKFQYKNVIIGKSSVYGIWIAMIKRSGRFYIFFMIGLFTYSHTSSNNLSSIGNIPSVTWVPQQNSHI